VTGCLVGRGRRPAAASARDAGDGRPGGMSCRAVSLEWVGYRERGADELQPVGVGDGGEGLGIDGAGEQLGVLLEEPLNARRGADRQEPSRGVADVLKAAGCPGVRRCTPPGALPAWPPRFEPEVALKDVPQVEAPMSSSCWAWWEIRLLQWESLAGELVLESLESTS
jgi:hypothetical protein